VRQLRAYLEATQVVIAVINNETPPDPMGGHRLAWEIRGTT
jgi:hypothetical protein